MASFDYDIMVDNRSATYPSYPLIYIDMSGNMSAVDAYTPHQTDANVIEIVRAESPNFGRSLYITQITLSPAPTAIAPVRVYIDGANRQMYVDPDSSHAQAGEFLNNIHQSSRFFDLLPGVVNWVQIRNSPNDKNTLVYGVRWRKAYSG